MVSHTYLGFLGIRSHSGNDGFDVYTPIRTLGIWSPFALWERVIGCFTLQFTLWEFGVSGRIVVYQSL